MLANSAASSLFNKSIANCSSIHIHPFKVINYTVILRELNTLYIHIAQINSFNGLPHIIRIKLIGNFVNNQVTVKLFIIITSYSR
ncbi:hypothetical protein SKL01_25110 [Staphylococcus kloosii]|uniref:Uncharacterized protein n=1 Tax=Staphylococcus kloosii TaxID=29384 RepID=A0ABQ0XPI3_9STAP|nr:hypothetical protein SKL01_25110 [Staphylococcus kloosii]